MLLVQLLFISNTNCKQLAGSSLGEQYLSVVVQLDWVLLVSNGSTRLGSLGEQYWSVVVQLDWVLLVSNGPTRLGSLGEQLVCYGQTRLGSLGEQWPN